MEYLEIYKDMKQYLHSNMEKMDVLEYATSYTIKELIEKFDSYKYSFQMKQGMKDVIDLLLFVLNESQSIAFDETFDCIHELEIKIQQTIERLVDSNGKQ